MDTEKKKRLIGLIRKLSYRTGEFTLSSGIRSDYLIDLKPTALHPEGACLLGELAVERIQSEGLSIEAVGGLTLGADPLATSMSLAAYRQGLHWPAFIVRKESKSHGSKKLVEGIENLTSETRILVLEDVSTTGSSAERAVEALRSEGLCPVAVMTMIDREQGARDRFQSLGLPFFSLLDLQSIRSP